MRRDAPRPLTTLVLLACVAALSLSTTDRPGDVDATSVEPPPAGADGGGTVRDVGSRWIRSDPGPSVTSSEAEPAAAPAPTVAPTVAPTHEVVGPPSRLAAEGWLVAGGRSPVVGTGDTIVPYTVEVADDLIEPADLDGFAATVTAILSDPDHGWTASGAVRLQRVDDPERAAIRVLLASPDRVDELCGRASLDTRGMYSCWNGRFAAINADRWFAGVPHVDDQSLYRTYLVNHEVGHGLGHGHEACPAPGELAPVMQQLSVSDEGCVPNGVPFP